MNTYFIFWASQVNCMLFQSPIFVCKLFLYWLLKTRLLTHEKHNFSQNFCSGGVRRSQTTYTYQMISLRCMRRHLQGIYRVEYSSHSFLSGYVLAMSKEENFGFAKTAFFKFSKGYLNPALRTETSYSLSKLINMALQFVLSFKYQKYLHDLTHCCSDAGIIIHSYSFKLFHSSKPVKLYCYISWSFNILYSRLYKKDW